MSAVETWAFFECPFEIISMFIYLSDWWAVDLEILEESLGFCQVQGCKKHTRDT